MQISSNQPNSRNIARMLMTWLTVFLLVLETTVSLQRHCVGRCHKPRTNANNDGLVETMKFSAAFENDALPVSHLRFRKISSQQLRLFLLSALWLSGSPMVAKAASIPDQQQYNPIVVQKQSTLLPACTSTSVLTANYASEGSGGLPFLSTFQTPGAVPRPIDDRLDDREARNRAFDEAFDQDKRDRDAYYAKMALQKREKTAMELKARRAELGLDVEDAGPRFGDEKVAGMASLEKYILEKDPDTMTPAEMKKFLQLQQQQQQR